MRPKSTISNTTDNDKFKTKSAAHHEMFNSSQAPWGIEKTTGSVPMIKHSNNPDRMQPAGKKTADIAPDGSKILSESTVQEMQNELS